MNKSKKRNTRKVNFLVSRLPIPFKSKSGEISKEPSWVIIQNGYLYIAKTFCSVVRLAIKEWKDDKHLVG